MSRCSFLFIALLGLSYASILSAHADEIIVDDFNDANANQNALGGFTGSFSDGATSAFCVESLNAGGLRLRFSREADGASFAGFFTQLAFGSGTLDISATDVNQLSFKIRGDLLNNVPAGGQNFQIEIKDVSGRTLLSALTNVPGFESGAPSNEPHEVNIPFSAMLPRSDALDFTQLREIAFVFNQESTPPNTAGFTSEIFIDDLKFTHRENPPASLLALDPENPDFDLIARSQRFIGPSNRQVLTVAEDAASLRGTALKLYFDLTNSGDYFAFAAFQPADPVDLSANDFKTLKFRLRKTGVNSAPSKVVFELKHDGNVVGTALSYAVGEGNGGTQYTETVYPIYSAGDVIDEVTLVFFDGGAGTFLIDKIAFSTDAYMPNNPAFTPNAGPVLSDDALLDFIQSKSTQYFIDERVGGSVHIRDRSSPDSASSIAATGFALSVLTVISERFDPNPESPWHIQAGDGTVMTPDEARRRAETTLDEFLRIQSLQPDLETGAGDPERRYGIAGFFYHFLKADGTRSGESEVSVIDTALFMSSALQAGEYFGGAVKTKVEQLFQNIDWDYMFFDAEDAFRLSWMPAPVRGFTVPDEGGIGFLSDGTIGRPTDELLLVNFLALASDPESIDFQQALYSYLRIQRAYIAADGTAFPVVNSYFGSGFTYLYAQLFYDFEALGPDRPELLAVELEYPHSVHWWQNAVNAIRANRQFAIDRSVFYPFSFHEYSWGISAVERPDGRYEGLYGAPPVENGPTHDGTVATYLPFSSLPFFRVSASESLSDNLAFQVVRYGYDHMFNQLFGIYGPVDSYNDRAEFSQIFLGLDQGPIVLSIENYRSRLLWDTFMQNEHIRAACEIAFGHVPVFSAISDQNGTVGEPLSFTLTIADADGDGGLEVSSENLPTGATLVNDGSGNAMFNWTPEAQHIGTRVLSFKARDTFRENPEPLLVPVTVATASGAPVAFFNSPEPNATVSGLISIRATTSDPDNTRFGLLYLDDRLLRFEFGGTISHDFHTAYFPNGSHALRVVFYHQTTGQVISAGETVIFQNGTVLMPGIHILNPDAGQIISDVHAVIFEVQDPGETLLYRMFIDGVEIGFHATQPGPFTLDSARFVNGTHVLRIEAYSRFFREFISEEIEIEIQNASLPPFHVSAPASGSTVSGVISISVENNGAGTLILGRLFIDGRFKSYDLFPPFHFNLDTRQFSNGPHHIRVSAFSLTEHRIINDTIAITVEN